MSSKAPAVPAGEKIEPPQVQVFTGMKVQTPANKPAKANVKAKSKSAR